MQSLLKFVNSGNGMMGFAMILYGVWLMRAWQRQMGHLPFEGPDAPVPWYCFLPVLQIISFPISFHFIGLFLFLHMILEGQEALLLEDNFTSNSEEHYEIIV